MLLVHKDISHMPITELENDSESIWVKVFANKTSHFVASWYRPPCRTSAEFQLFRESKKISNDQELIQSDPISCPQNQKGNN